MNNSDIDKVIKENYNKFSNKEIDYIRKTTVEQNKKDERSLIISKVLGKTSDIPDFILENKFSNDFFLYKILDDIKSGKIQESKKVDEKGFVYEGLYYTYLNHCDEPSYKIEEDYSDMGYYKKTVIDEYYNKFIPDKFNDIVIYFYWGDNDFSIPFRESFFIIKDALMEKLHYLRNEEESILNYPMKGRTNFYIPELEEFLDKKTFFETLKTVFVSRDMIFNLVHHAEPIVLEKTHNTYDFFEQNMFDESFFIGTEKETIDFINKDQSKYGGDPYTDLETAIADISDCDVLAIQIKNGYVRILG